MSTPLIISLTFVSYAITTNINYLCKVILLTGYDGPIGGLMTLWMPFLYTNRCVFLSMWHLDVSNGPVSWAMFMFVLFGGSVETYAYISGATTLAWYVLNLVYLALISVRMIYSAPVRYTEDVSETAIAAIMYLVAVIGGIVPVSISSGGDIVVTDAYVFVLWLYFILSPRRVEISNIELLAAVILLLAVIMNLFLYTYLGRVGFNDMIPEVIPVDMLVYIRGILEYVCLGLYDVCIATSVIAAYLRK